MGAVSKLDAAVLRAQTKDALVGLGWKPAIRACVAQHADRRMDLDVEYERGKCMVGFRVVVLPGPQDEQLRPQAPEQAFVETPRYVS